MRWLIAIALVLGACYLGCYSPQLAPCEVQCGSASPCPADLSCGSDDFCHAAGDSTTCATMLSVTIDGGGDVFSDPRGIDCYPNAGSGCANVPFTVGTQIVLTQMHLLSDSFGGWGGDACNGSTSMTCMFTIEMPMTVHAHFN